MKKSPCGRGSWWTRRGVLVLLAIAVVVVHECCCHPVAVSGTSSQQRLHGGKPNRRVVRPIARPAQCKHDTIFTDCFLCGKIAEANLIYGLCCERDTETVNFCNLLLS